MTLKPHSFKPMLVVGSPHLAHRLCLTGPEVVPVVLVDDETNGNPWTDLGASTQSPIFNYLPPASDVGPRNRRERRAAEKRLNKMNKKRRK